mgnify:CR=1 FL=1
MTGTLFRDLLFTMVLFFVVIVIWMLPHIHDPAKSADGQEPPGNITAIITWPAGDTDIDLWVTGPGEPVPIGYSNKGGVLWNLLRDDLGAMPDATSLNYENAYTRGSIAGEFIINLHCYRCPILPQKVNVEVGSARQAEGGKGTVIIATATVTLTSNGQEKTAVRFKLDQSGNLIPGSLNAVFKPLRSSTKN